MSTLFLQKKNNSFTTLLAAILSGDTSLTIQVSDEAKFPSSGTPNFMISVWYASGTVAVGEIMKVTAVSGNTFTVTRAQENTSSQAFDPAVGTVNIQMLDTAGIQQQQDTAINTAETNIATNTTSIANLNTGWLPLSSSLAYSSLDAPTGVMTLTNANTLLSKGMRLKFNQAQSLTSYWSFDTNSNDGVGANNGTDTAMTYTAGKFSNAATFNGTTSLISIADTSTLKPTGAFTVGFWFKTSTDAKVIFQSYSANTNVAGIRIGIGGSGAHKLYLLTGKNTGTTNGTDFSYVVGQTSVDDGNFHYCVISMQNNYAQIYIDGVLDGSGYCFNPAFAATNYIRVGCGEDNGSNIAFWNGQIDDLFFINGYALGEDYISAQYALAAAQGTSALTVTKMALVTAVTSTTVTAYFGTDYALVSASITSPYYSSVKVPYGFPTNPNKWSVQFKDSTAQTQSSPTGTTYYNIGSLSVSFPIGAWNVIAHWNNSSDRTGSITDNDTYAALSTSSSSVSDDEMKVRDYINVVGTSGERGGSFPIVINKGITLAVKTTYYPIIMNTQSIASLTFENSSVPMFIKSVSSYL